ncbi:uncharacterized protein LOC132251623 [Alligator mississippiensis]|uniref:uncharacterized protein LOC132251623 n=1 Tax=Alligator mississippiensis TaxID=8496 RepID=UPI002877A9DE|nr:uncharacterized protein LOC132251623 [Alligator mississippiensis]
MNLGADLALVLLARRVGRICPIPLRCAAPSPFPAPSAGPRAGAARVGDGRAGSPAVAGVTPLCWTWLGFPSSSLVPTGLIYYDNPSPRYRGRPSASSCVSGRPQAPLGARTGSLTPPLRRLHGQSPGHRQGAKTRLSTKLPSGPLAWGAVLDLVLDSHYDPGNKDANWQWSSWHRLYPPRLAPAPSGYGPHPLRGHLVLGKQLRGAAPHR